MPTACEALIVTKPVLSGGVKIEKGTRLVSADPRFTVMLPFLKSRKAAEDPFADYARAYDAAEPSAVEVVESKDSKIQELEALLLEERKAREAAETLLEAAMQPAPKKK